MTIKLAIIFGNFFNFVMGCIIGRHSYRIVRDRYLHSKEKELINYHAQLMEIESELEYKEREIRNKWQRMVVDASNYQASIGGFDTGKWNDMDDVYLNSWSSAED